MSVAEQMAVIKRGAVEILIEKELEEKIRGASQDQGRL